MGLWRPESFVTTGLKQDSGIAQYSDWLRAGRPGGAGVPVPIG
jgi:hypothetical protein